MASSQHSMPKVLIVEDDDDLRRGLARRLRLSGFDVLAVGDGLAAVSVARAEIPDLVLLDIGLPAGDGISVMRRYANLAPLCGIPVVVMTGRDPRVAQRELDQFDVAAFLSKPFENDQLLSALSHALRGVEHTPTIRHPEPPLRGEANRVPFGGSGAQRPPSSSSESEDWPEAL